MKRMCRSALALGTAGFLSVGTIAGVGLPTTVIAVAQAEETCSETDFARITEGHQDMALKSDDGQLEFVLKDDHAEKEHESGKFVVQVSDETKMTSYQDFADGPVVKNLPSKSGGHGFDPWSGR